MEIVKAFNTNTLHTEIVIKGTLENPLFRASDIGEVLEINNIRTSTLHFDDTEKVVHSMNTPGGIQQVSFLTEKGLYKLLFKSRKPIAEQFQNWVCEIIRDIRLTGKYELEKQLEQQKTQIKETKEELENQKKQSQLEKELLREQTLLEQFPDNTQAVYYGMVDDVSSLNEKLIKFGNSNFLRNRVETHKKTYTNFRLINVFKVSNQILIENLIKKHPVLKKKRRNVVIDEKNYTELIAINDFTFEQIDEMIKQIIKENEYNIENYNKLLEENVELKNQIKTLIEDNEKLNKNINKLKQKVSSLKIPDNVKNLDANIPDKGIILYILKCNDNSTNDKYKCGMTRNSNLDKTIDMYKQMFPNSELVYSVRAFNTFTEKIMIFMLKKNLLHLGDETYNGSLDDIKTILNIVVKIEEKLIKKNVSLQYILDSFTITNVGKEEQEYIEPEVPNQRKAPRSIDQVNPNTGEVVATYKNIEEAGRMMGLTTKTAVGISVRNKTICKGFAWRYSGVSHDDQFKDQPVIKISCKTGEKTFFKNIADASRDIGISAPGLRNRILTKVHINDHHWVFNKEATHYK